MIIYSIFIGLVGLLLSYVYGIWQAINYRDSNIKPLLLGSIAIALLSIFPLLKLEEYLEKHPKETVYKGVIEKERGNTVALNTGKIEVFSDTELIDIKKGDRVEITCFDYSRWLYVDDYCSIKKQEE